MEPSRRFQLPASTLLSRAELLAELAEQAEAGYRRTPWGGPETGGLLLGTRHGDRLVVSESRPIACEHEFGPSFHLSPADHEALRSQLESIGRVRHVEVLGWYHTTSRDLEMGPETRLLVDEYFHEPWQVALVIRRGP